MCIYTIINQRFYLSVKKIILHETKICELVETSILTKLTETIDKKNTALCRANRLIILRNFKRLKTDKIRKQVIKIFKQLWVDIDTKTNVNKADILGVTFILKNKKKHTYY